MLPPWISCLIPFLQPAATFVVGVGTIRLGRAQWKLARDKQRHDLYKLRHDLFRKVMGFVSQQTQKGGATIEDIREFSRSTAECEFLFQPDVKAFVGTIHQRSLELWYCNQAINSESADIQNLDFRKEQVVNRAKLLSNFSEQFSVGIALFGPYLSFKEF